jgi:hypothetical protein
MRELKLEDKLQAWHYFVSTVPSRELQMRQTCNTQPHPGHRHISRSIFLCSTSILFDIWYAWMMSRSSRRTSVTLAAPLLPQPSPECANSATSRILVCSHARLLRKYPHSTVSSHKRSRIPLGLRPYCSTWFAEYSHPKGIDPIPITVQ